MAFSRAIKDARNVKISILHVKISIHDPLRGAKGGGCGGI
jgi:hypothetical protein